MQDFLPVTKKEMKQRGWEQVDFAYITGCLLYTSDAADEL